jgi:hypothetical protein
MESWSHVPVERRKGWSEGMQQQLRAPGWHIGRTRGKPFTAFGMQVVPIGFAVHVSWPGGGFTWHRPVAVEVRHGDNVRRLAIHDVTLEAIVSIVMTGIAIVILSTSWKRWIHTKRRNIS